MKNNFLKNASIVFTVNSVCVVINVLVNFIIPILFGEKLYAYYQLENLYCTYLWIISLGWHEGIYLYYGGKTEAEINKSEIATQFWLFAGYMFTASTIVCIFGMAFVQQTDKQAVLALSATSIIIEALRYIYFYYLICTNGMKKYSAYLIFDRILYISFLAILCIIRTNDYRILIGADILSKMIVLLAILKNNRIMFFRKLLPIKAGLIHTRELIFSGINITFSGFVNGMVKGTIRFAIEAYWGVLIFGKVSLALSISNMFTQFVQSVSTVLFPVLRRFDYKDKEKIYCYLSDGLDSLMSVIFLSYLPAVWILKHILPQYEDGLKYMAVLLPLCLYDARNIVINNTYLKALHKEKAILISSLITTGFSFMLAFLAVYICHNLDMAVCALVVLAVIRNIVSEYQLSKCISIKMGRNFVGEIVLTLAFISGNWYIGGIYGTLFYLVILLLYLWLKRKRIKKLIIYLKSSI